MQGGCTGYRLFLERISEGPCPLTALADSDLSKAQLATTNSNIVSDCRLRARKVELVFKPLINLFGCMPLFSRGLLVLHEPEIDGLSHEIGQYFGIRDRGLSARRDRILKGLTNSASVNTSLSGDLAARLTVNGKASSDILE